jgi:hypothetical protein
MPQAASSRKPINPCVFADIAETSRIIEVVTRSDSLAGRGEGRSRP